MALMTQDELNSIPADLKALSVNPFSGDVNPYQFTESYVVSYLAEPGLYGVELNHELYKVDTVTLTNNVSVFAYTSGPTDDWTSYTTALTMQLDPALSPGAGQFKASWFPDPGTGVQSRYGGMLEFPASMNGARVVVVGWAIGSIIQKRHLMQSHNASVDYVPRFQDFRQIINSILKQVVGVVTAAKIITEGEHDVQGLLTALAGLTVATGDITATLGNLILTAGGVTASAGTISAKKGNITDAPVNPTDLLRLTDAYTKTQLQTSGQASVAWGNLTGKPALPAGLTSLQIVGAGSAFVPGLLLIVDSGSATPAATDIAVDWSPNGNNFQARVTNTTTRTVTVYYYATW